MNIDLINFLKNYSDHRNNLYIAHAGLKHFCRLDFSSDFLIQRVEIVQNCFALSGSSAGHSSNDSYSREISKMVAFSMIVGQPIWNDVIILFKNCLRFQKRQIDPLFRYFFWNRLETVIKITCSLISSDRS